AGKYLLILQKEGYPSISKVIETSQSKASFLLSFRQGISVEFTSNPPGAELHLDGKKVGVTPCIVEGLFAKTYNAELTIEGYEDLKQSVDISINGDKVSFTLRKLNPLAIISDPPGQIAYLDGNPAGKTPLIVNIVDGRYEIAVGKIKKQVVLPKDQIVKIENPEKAIFELINESGTVQKYQGPSDAVLPKPPNGKYRLAIPIEGGRIYLSEYNFADKPQRVSSYVYSKDGKTIIRSVGGARSIEIVTPKESIELGMGEVEIDIKQIEEKIGKFDTLNMMVGQGVWSAKFTLTKAEIMAGIIFEVEVVR
nr:PEGA domain-containing protein [Caldisericia bacterium]